MELWIRSQDREKLVQVDCLCIEINEYGKKNYDIVQGCITLGTYKTKERALEILDKIENKMAYINDEYVAGHNSLMIFEMPKE